MLSVHNSKDESSLCWQIVCKWFNNCSRFLRFPSRETAQRLSDAKETQPSFLRIAYDWEKLPLRLSQSAWAKSKHQNHVLCWSKNVSAMGNFQDDGLLKTSLHSLAQSRNRPECLCQSMQVKSTHQNLVLIETPRHCVTFICWSFSSWNILISIVSDRPWQKPTFRCFKFLLHSTKDLRK